MTSFEDCEPLVERVLKHRIVVLLMIGLLSNLVAYRLLVSLIEQIFLFIGYPLCSASKQKAPKVDKSP